MTPTNPLAPSENAEINAALKAACAELDGMRLAQIDHCISERETWLENPGSLEGCSTPIMAEDEYMIAHAYERAIGFLACQLTFH